MLTNLVAGPWYSDEEDDDLFSDVAAMIAQGEIPGFCSTYSSEEDEEPSQKERKPNKRLNFESSYRRFQLMYFIERLLYNK